MKENTEVNTRQERRFIYQDGKHAVIGHAKVRYEPNPALDVFGSIEIFTDFPVKRNTKMKLMLSLYPIPLDKDDDNRKNIVSVKDGIHDLFVESNKLAASVIRNITGIKLKDFDYRNFGILRDRDEDDEDVFLPDGSVLRRYSFNGCMYHKVKDRPYLYKGDKLMLSQCLELVDPVTNKNTCVWDCEYDPSKNKFSLFDKIFRKPFLKIFNKKKYKARYVIKTSFRLSVKDVRYCDIIPIEDNDTIIATSIKDGSDWEKEVGDVSRDHS